MRKVTPPTSASWFDDEVTAVSLTTVLARDKPSTKAQQSFAQLVGKIEVKRELLKQWQACETRYHQRVAAEMQPLQVKLRAGQRQMIDLVDDMLSRPGPGRRLTRLERAKLEQLLLNLVTGLLDGRDDQVLEALHDKYSGVSHRQVRQSQMKMTEAMLNDVLGLDVEAGATTPEELLERARKQMEERVEEQARQKDEWENKRAAGQSRASQARAEAAQARRDQAAREISQSLREVYRKLASALHPDREPDAEARQRKTLMMQRVNQAYADDDLLTLLGLQLEIEQIDAAHLANIPPQRLAHYIQILREQLVDLEFEIKRCTEAFRLDVWRGPVLTPASVDRHLTANIEELRLHVRMLQYDLKAFRDPRELRATLKAYALEQDFNDPDEIGDLMESFFEAPPPARRGKKRRPG